MKEPSFKKDEIYFIPLGGAEEFGMNFNVYGMDGKWLAVDCGIAFADEKYPGVDLLLPDPLFFDRRHKDLAGLVITHAHEDHIGAVCHLWPQLKCPVYCTRFTAHVLREKMKDEPASTKGMVIHEVAVDQQISIGPFHLQFIPVSHSIPDTVSFSIRTPHGLIVHSGDWNADPTPVLGTRTNKEMFKNCGRAGVLAYIGDSTNAPVPGRGKSEADVEAGLEQVFKDCHGRITVTVFASNIARIQSIARAAKRAGRHVAVAGRSLHRMVGCARASGYLKDIPDFIPDDRLDSIPHNRMILIATGSQGEPRAALARMANGDHPYITLGAGDTVIFSARAIPGNEKEINTVKNNLIKANARVVSPDDTAHTIHVSGHPYEDEILDMFDWLRPRLVVPVHGERIQLEAQAALARRAQIEQSIVPGNGTVIRLAPGQPEVIGRVETGLLALEPSRIVPADHATIAERRKLQFSGVVHATIVLDGKNRVLNLAISEVGLFDETQADEAELHDGMVATAKEALADMLSQNRISDDALAEEIRIAIKRYVRDILQIKTKVTVHLVRV